MRIHFNRSGRGRQGYTLAEIMVAVGLFIVMFLALYMGFAASFTVIQSARENLRATQILMQRMETVRLYTWDQLNSSTYVKPTFTDAYAPLGVTYHGTVSVSAPTHLGSPSYANNMKTVTVEVTWTNATGGTKVGRRREMVTQVSRFGLQNYIFGVPSTK
jgi:Tfp pilus assembly protein PilV